MVLKEEIRSPTECHSLGPQSPGTQQTQRPSSRTSCVSPVFRDIQGRQDAKDQPRAHSQAQNPLYRYRRNTGTATKHLLRQAKPSYLNNKLLSFKPLTQKIREKNRQNVEIYQPCKENAQKSKGGHDRHDVSVVTTQLDDWLDGSDHIQSSTYHKNINNQQSELREKEAKSGLTSPGSVEEAPLQPMQDAQKRIWRFQGPAALGQEKGLSAATNGQKSGAPTNHNQEVRPTSTLLLIAKSQNNGALLSAIHQLEQNEKRLECLRREYAGQFIVQYQPNESTDGPGHSKAVEPWQHAYDSGQRGLAFSTQNGDLGHLPRSEVKLGALGADHDLNDEEQKQPLQTLNHSEIIKALINIQNQEEQEQVELAKMKKDFPHMVRISMELELEKRLAEQKKAATSASQPKGHSYQLNVSANISPQMQQQPYSPMNTHEIERRALLKVSEFKIHKPINKSQPLSHIPARRIATSQNRQRPAPQKPLPTNAFPARAQDAMYCNKPTSSWSTAVVRKQQQHMEVVSTQPLSPSGTMQ